MIKIDKYTVTGYKNIKIADVTLDNLNVIIGPNNSGKSNLLQSISFLNYIINGSTDDLERSFANGFYTTYFRGIVPLQNLLEDEQELVTFNVSFSNSQTSNIFQYALALEYEDDPFGDSNFKIVSESLDFKESGKPGKPSTVFSRKKNKVKYGAELTKIGFSQVPDYISVVRILKIINSQSGYFDAITSLNTIIKTPTFFFSNTELLKAESTDRLNVFNGRTVAFDLEKEILNLEQGLKWEIFKSAIKNILNIDDAHVHVFRNSERTSKEEKSEQRYLSFEHFNSFKNIKQMSDGTILIIALITKILNSQSSIFFIEEPENSIHPRALVDLLGFLQSYSEDKQFVISSHSIALLNRTKLENILTSCIMPDGQSEIRNVNDRKELKARLKSGFVNFSDELFFGNEGGEEFED